METFRTSYRRDFTWPWALPVRLSAWRPPERTLLRPREGPAAPCPECPCPEHGWGPGAAGGLDRYGCLAGREARLHQHAQALRRQGQDCLSRSRTRSATHSEHPGVRDWATTYTADFKTQRGAGPRPLSYVGVLEELVSPGIPPAPLGRSLFAAYDDPTRFRSSAHTVPVYDPMRPVAWPRRRCIEELWRDNFPGDSEYGVSYSDGALETARRCQPFKYPLAAGAPVDVVLD